MLCMSGNFSVRGAVHRCAGIIRRKVCRARAGAFNCVLRLLRRSQYAWRYGSSATKAFPVFLRENSEPSLCLCAIDTALADACTPVHRGFLFHAFSSEDRRIWYGNTLEQAEIVGELDYCPSDCLLAVSPGDGRVIGARRGERGVLHVWADGRNHTLAPESSDGRGRLPMGWLYNSGVCFCNGADGIEYCLFAEYEGMAIDKGGFYVWKGTYPYTHASDWKTVLHVPFQYFGEVAPGTISHFHHISRDPFSGILYLTSGDRVGQQKWWYSMDMGETWHLLYEDTQNSWEEHTARLIHFLYTEEFIYWASDHGINHSLNRIGRNRESGLIDVATREKLAGLPFGQGSNSCCLMEKPAGIFMYERIDTGEAFMPYYGEPVYNVFYSFERARLEVVGKWKLSSKTWGGHRGKCYVQYCGENSKPAMGFSADTPCIFRIPGLPPQSIGTICYDIVRK